MRLGLSTKITQFRATPSVEYTTTYTASVADGLNPDTYVAKIKAPSQPILATVNQQVGKRGGKATADYAVFTRFELDVPYGSTILGVKIEWRASGGYDTSGGTNMFITGGWIIPQTGSYKWQDPTGVLEWNNDSANVPFAEFDNGGVDDLTVFQGGAAAFHNVSSVIKTGLLQFWSIGEGIAAETTVTGLVDQLQAYIDANESLYASGIIPAMFQLYRPYTLTTDHWQGLIPADNGNLIYQPKLTVNYMSP